MLEEVEFVNKYVKTSHVIKWCLKARWVLISSIYFFVYKNVKNSHVIKMMLKGAMSINLKEDVINLVILQLQSLPIVNLETPKKAKI